MEPFDGIRHIQRARDTPVANSIYLDLQARCVTPADKARLRAVAAPHAGDWLNAPPLTAIVLRLSNEAVRVAVLLQARLHNMPASHMHLRHNSRRQRAARTVLSEKWTKTYKALATE